MKKKEITIGICVILALCFLFVGIEYLKGINVFKPANYYEVSYTDVNGLALSAPVTLNGYKVGQVNSIEYEYDNPGHIRVELSLDKALKVPTGSEAIIVTDMLGTATVNLKLAANNEYHNVGDQLIGKTDKGLMSNVSDDIMPTVINIIPKVDSLITAINTLVADPALQTSIKRLDGITSNLEMTMTKLNKSVNTLPVIMTNVEGTTGNLNKITGNLATVSDDVAQMPLDSTMMNLKVTTDNLRQLTEDLKNPNSSLGLLMNDPALYNNLNSTVSSLDSLFIDIKKNPKRYINIKLL
ncbi:MAG: MlaD family protein [Muribaculaceae bacterium]|nr:MlaD family protein [Muribaculaceae bacterium]